MSLSYFSDNKLGTFKKEVFVGGSVLCQPPCWPEKNELGFRWSKKAEITLETIGLWQNISISIFKFSIDKILSIF